MDNKQLFSIRTKNEPFFFDSMHALTLDFFMSVDRGKQNYCANGTSHERKKLYPAESGQGILSGVESKVLVYMSLKTQTTHTGNDGLIIQGTTKAQPVT